MSRREKLNWRAGKANRLSVAQGRLYLHLFNRIVRGYRWRLLLVVGGRHEGHGLLGVLWTAKSVCGVCGFGSDYPDDRLGVFALPGVEVVLDRTQLEPNGKGWRDPNRKGRKVPA